MRQSPGQHHHMLVWVIVALIAVVGGGLVVFVLINQPSRQAVPPIEPVLDPLMQPVLTPQATPTPQDVVVYISGAVQQPDVYALPYDARVKDVVLAAGGFLADADSEQVNLAARIEDEQHIHIPHIGEEPLPAGRSDGAGSAGTGVRDDSVAASLINLNRANQSELEELPGVGQVIAQRIVEYRQANGPFTSVDELQNVTGVGPAMFEKISPLVTVEE